MDNFFISDTLKLKKDRWFLLLFKTGFFKTNHKKTEQFFKIFLLNAVYRTNPATTKKLEMILEPQDLNNLRCESIFSKKRLYRR